MVERSDRQQVQVTISARETNRLAVEGRRIASVVPGLAGQIVSKKDDGQGALYFSLGSDASTFGTVTLFVTDDQGVTYRLLLVPRAVPGEEVVLRPPVEMVSTSRRAAGAGGAAGDSRAVSYERRVKDLMLTMADDDLAAGATGKIAIDREIPLWKEARLVLAAQYPQPDIVGERYILTNVSPEQMIIAEQELFKPGVRAVAIRNQTLLRGEATEIYIVRERAAHE